MRRMRVIQEIRELLDQRPIPVEDILAGIARLAQARDPEHLLFIVELANMDELFDEIIAIPALASLPAWGLPGLDALRAHLLSGLHGTDAQKILLALAADIPLPDLSLMLPPDWFPRCGIVASRDIASHALQILRELILEQTTDREIQRRLIVNFAMEAMVTKGCGSHTEHCIRPPAGRVCAAGVTFGPSRHPIDR